MNSIERTSSPWQFSSYSASRKATSVTFKSEEKVFCKTDASGLTDIVIDNLFREAIKFFGNELSAQGKSSYTIEAASFIDAEKIASGKWTVLIGKLT